MTFICRNEAPYLKEWIEYHRMIGFKSFLLMNHNSTDDTQCLLDEYASRGIVKRIPEDLAVSDYHLDENVDNVFDACTRYLKSHPDQFDTTKTWMMTHDIDEFVWFNRTEQIRTLQDAITELIDENGMVAKTLEVPRFFVGSSEKDYYHSDLVLNRFTHRFRLQSCPFKRSKQRTHRRLYYYKSPISFCDEQDRHDSYNNCKSISLVESLAENCSDPKTGKDMACHFTHYHTLNSSKRKHYNAFGKQHSFKSLHLTREQDERYLGMHVVGKKIAIMHYLTKSRQEFYERVCSSVWLKKYRICPTCTPESYFNITESFANNYPDDRMLPFAAKLKSIVDVSKIGDSCNTEYPRHSFNFFRECLASGNHQQS